MSGNQLQQYWYVACRSSDLSRKKPLQVRLFGRSFALFRDQNGIAAALEDRCVHRHAPLSAGRLCAGKVQCPYHGWEYDVQGNVTSIPALGRTNTPPVGLATGRFPTCEQDGLVWIVPANEAPSDLPRRIATMEEAGWTRFIMKTRFRGTVEACLENFLDCPHATFVHRGWFRSATNLPVRAKVRTLIDGAVAEYFDEPRKKSVIWALFSPQRGEMQHTDRFIIPSTSQVDYIFPNGLRYNITSCCSPVAENEIEVYTVMSFRAWNFGFLVRLFFAPLSRWIIHQDVLMMDLVANNTKGKATAQVISTQADLLGSLIWEWRSALADGREPPAVEQEHEVCFYL